MSNNTDLEILGQDAFGMPIRYGSITTCYTQSSDGEDLWFILCLKKYFKDESKIVGIGMITGGDPSTYAIDDCRIFVGNAESMLLAYGEDPTQNGSWMKPYIETISTYIAYFDKSQNMEDWDD